LFPAVCSWHNRLFTLITKSIFVVGHHYSLDFQKKVSANLNRLILAK